MRRHDPERPDPQPESAILAVAEILQEIHEDLRTTNDRLREIADEIREVRSRLPYRP